MNSTHHTPGSLGESASISPRHALRPLVALLLGTALMGTAQAKDPVRWYDPGWHFSSRVMFTYDVQRNLQLRDSNISKQYVFMPEGRLVSRYQHSKHWGFVLDVEPYSSTWGETGTSAETDASFYLPQLFVEAQLKEYGTRVRLGRWVTDDERTWFYDTDFDGLNVTYEQGPYQLDAFVARADNWRHDLFNRHSEHVKGDKLAAAMGTWRLADDHEIILKALNQNNHRKDLRLTHIAGGSIATPTKGMQHWAIASYVSGKEKGRSVRGEAIDLGATFFLDSGSRWNPRATVGYAWGSGDDGKGSDSSHHQTGMQTNMSYMGAVYDFKTYGTVLAPALTNLHVLTAAVGIAPMEKSSLDLVYHHYRQDETGEVSKMRITPQADLQNGRALGNGFDLVWGWNPTRAWKVQAYTGVFMPSNRFRASTATGAGKAANAWAFGVDVRYYPGK